MARIRYDNECVGYASNEGGRVVCEIQRAVADGIDTDMNISNGLLLLLLLLTMLRVEIVYINYKK
jgi:hypothetical protein